ncbi:MAG: tetratricopeptide repeat protein [bacterium]|nr:MAG: tetratricopeptide repeat protein [bacterium]
MRRVALAALALILVSCASVPRTPPAERPLTPREREARLLLEIERTKKQERARLDDMKRQTRRTGADFLLLQEKEARQRSIELYRTLLKTFPLNRGDYMAEASFRLAELLFDTERERIRSILETQGDTASVIPDFSEAIEAYRVVIENFPEHPLAEDALYGMAYCFTEQGDQDRAAEGYARLVQTFPDTRYAVEIHMRLGEHYFTMEDMNQAIEHYLFVVQRGQWEYREKALYKLGWCYYNRDDYDQAIDTFFSIIDLDIQRTTTGENLLNESMDIIARAYAESGGTPALVRRLEKRGPDPTSPLILLKLANLYRERSFYPEAIGTYRTYVNRYPAGRDLPAVLQHLVESYHVYGDLLASLEVSETLKDHIGPGTPWYSVASAEERSSAVALVLENLATSAGRRRARSQTGGREAELLQALADLTAYEAMAVSGTPCDTGYLKGIVLTELDRYPEAAASLNTLAQQEQCSDIAAKAILTSVAFQISTYEGLGKVDLPLLQGSVELLTTVAGERQEASRSILALGEITLNLEDPSGARAHFSRVIREYPDSPEAGKARMLIARTFFKEGEFRQAAAWFKESWRKAVEDRESAEAKRLHVYSLFKHAESLSASGKATEAAERFEAIYDQFPEADVAQVSLYNAGKIYKSIGLERKATSLFETLAASYTESEFASEALQMSVLILEALGDPVRAADDSMVLASRTEGRERAEALLKAAQLYSAGNAPARAASTRSAYIAQFPEPMEELTRQTHLLGRDLEALGDWPGAQAAFERTIALGKKGKDPSGIAGWAARSQLRIAENSFSRYDAYHLQPPVEDTILRKRELLQDVIRKFVAAGSYRTADVITASNYFIGRALELFKEDILSSPRPGGFNDAELEEYELLLQEMAYPFEEKALEAYRVNVTRAVSLEILDPWIEKTYERLAELAPWAYQREEEAAYPTTLVDPPPPRLPPLPDIQRVQAVGPGGSSTDGREIF